jgi:diguanylate cyclase (GGDEF)-like protein
MKHTILIIDDSPSARNQLREILQKTRLFQCYREAEDGLSGFKQLLERPVDVVLCDLEMPGMDGIKFLQLLATRPDLEHLPVIMLTGRDDAEAKIRVLGQGASDYVTKPFDPGELLARLKVQLKVKSLQDRLRESNRALKELAATDPLTGLANRRTLMTELEREFRRSQRSGSPLSLVMVDIDHFKRINDTYGHQNGDRVLIALADILKTHLRRYDLPSRFGGEEFALVLPETGPEETLAIAERIRTSIAGLNFDGDLDGLQVTASLGVAACPVANVKDVEDLIRESDDALYLAKKNGRNRIESAGDDGQQSLPHLNAK